MCVWLHYGAQGADMLCSQRFSSAGVWSRSGLLCRQHLSTRTRATGTALPWCSCRAHRVSVGDSCLRIYPMPADPGAGGGVVSVGVSLWVCVSVCLFGWAWARGQSAPRPSCSLAASPSTRCSCTTTCGRSRCCMDGSGCRPMRHRGGQTRSPSIHVRPTRCAPDRRGPHAWPCGR